MWCDLGNTWCARFHHYWTVVGSRDPLLTLLLAAFMTQNGVSLLSHYNISGGIIQKTKPQEDHMVPGRGPMNSRGGALTTNQIGGLAASSLRQ